MLKDITLGQFFPGHSAIHRMDPRTKLILTIVYIVALFVAQNWISYLVMMAFLVFCIWLSKIPPKSILRGMKPLVFILVFTAVLNLFYTDGGVELVRFGSLAITSEGLKRAIFMIWRILMLISGTFLLTYTTSPISLTDGLESLLNPLKRIHVPVHELAMMMSIALRFIPTLIEETDKIMNAQKARGADFETGSIIQRAKALVPILVPLFISAFRRADELATAMEISRTLRFPVATRVETFAGGRAELVEMTVKEEWPLVDKTLMEINRNLGIDLLFCAIVRNGQAFVPKGDTKIQAGDVIYLTGAAEKFRSSFRKLHLFKKPLQSVIIAGGGRVSHYLTGILLKQGLKVTVVDPRPHVAERLARECPGAAVMQDDVMRYFDSMLETDFAHTDAFIAITSNDEYNLVASMYAESQGISKVVTRINAKSRLKVLPKTSKICTVSRNDVAADRIFAYSRSLMNASGDDKVESLYRLMDGKIEFIELNIDDKDKNLNIPLKNLKLKRNVLVAFIIRDTQTIIPRGDDEIHDGDTVLIGSINHHIAELKDIFAD